MPVLDAFTSFGFLEFSSDDSLVQKDYNAQVAALGGAFDLTPGTHQEASVYARAHVHAAARATLQRAGNQQNPLLAIDCLPNLETDYGVVPGANDSILTRQRNVYAKKTLSAGARLTNVYAALRAILGSAFIAYFPVPFNHATIFPSAPGSYLSVHAANVALPAKLVTLAAPVAQTGSQTVAYTNLDETAGEIDLLVGDVVMVGVGNTLQGERVTVTAVAGAGTSSRSFTATFTKSHDLGAIGTTGDWPLQISTTRLSYIVVTAAAALDPNVRRQANNVMASLARGVSQWAIVSATTFAGLAGTVGPLTVGGAMGCLTVASQNFSVLA